MGARSGYGSECANEYRCMCYLGRWPVDRSLGLVRHEVVPIGSRGENYYHFEGFFGLTDFPQKNGDLKPRRIRDLSAILKNASSGAQESTGASSLCFTPDSSKLVVASSITSIIHVVDLGTGSSSPRVLKKFDHHRQHERLLGGRIVKGRRPQPLPQLDSNNEEEQEPDLGDEQDEEPEHLTGAQVATIWRMAVSPDGQWLATTDDHRQTHIFNFDSIQVCRAA